MARNSFLQGAPNSDFPAKKLSIPIKFLRLQSELKKG
jgi:hypothetical protein